ncbi:YihY/virulence factor BrkB family protein [Undibacterium sp. TJN25]|uniref:YihY/virulence factor BrkB family protein n=1 Tax=Undibacterium sp. TJN25 TaxID=3413056 RepID=UPI003BF38B90
MRLMLISSVEQWITQRAASKGAALAFYTLFSMAPILVLVIAIVGTVFDGDMAQKEIFAQLTALIGPSSSDAIQVLLAGAHNPTSGRIATTVATIVLLVGATSVFAELKASLDEIWQVPTTYQPGIIGLIRTRILSFGLVLVLAFLLLVSLVISAALAILERFWAGWAQGALIISPLSSVFSFAVIACMFAVIYKMLPQIRLSWSDVWIGALGTAGLFSLGKYAIGVYLGNSAVASGYGAAGSVVALLLWIYYSSQIFFLGAEFTRQYAEYFGSLQKPAQIRNKLQNVATP